MIIQVPALDPKIAAIVTAMDHQKQVMKGF